MMRRTRLLWLAGFLLLLAACGGNEADNRPRAQVFVTNTPLPTSTPRPTSTPNPGSSETILTSNFSRVDDAISIKYPDGWVFDTTGDEVHGEITLGSTRAAQRGNLSEADELSVRLIWSPVFDLTEAALAPDADSKTVLSALIAEYDDPATSFESPLTTVVGDRRAARADGQSSDGINTVLYLVDFGSGVAGYYTFKTSGDVDDFLALIEALIEATSYGGPPALMQEEEERIPPILTVEHEGAVVGAVWNADDSRLISWSEDGSVRFWNASNGQNPLTIQERTPVNSVQFSQDESHVLVLAEGQSLRIYNAVTGGLIRDLDVLGVMQTYRWSPDEQLIAGININYASNISTAPVWDFDTGEIVTTLRPGVSNTINGVTWDAASTHLILYDSGAQGTVWEVASKTPVMSVNHDSQIFGAAWNPDGSRLMTWSEDKTVRVWDTADGRLLLSLNHPASPPRGARWSQDGSRILSWQQDRVLRLWDVASGEQIFEAENPPAMGGADWNTAQNWIISWTNPASTTQLVRIWDANTGQRLFSFPDQLITGADALNARETRLLTWSYGKVTLWDTHTGEAVLTFDHPRVAGARWSHDYRYVLSWSSDGSVYVWDAESEPVS